MTKNDDDDSLRGKAELFKKIRIEQKRSMKLRDNERALVELIQNLDTKYSRLLVVVEGAHDIRILRQLGLRAPILKTQSRLPRYRLIEQIVANAGTDGQVLILTDFDQEGNETSSYIERQLEIAKIKTLQGVRVKIRNLMGNWRCIEELASLFKRRDSPESKTL